MAIRAIATDYSGITFISTLEADWAKNLDACGIRWTYEPEGVKLPSGTNYRPDLYLQGITTWLEVKGPHDQRIDKPHGLAVACLHSSGCSSGDPGERTEVNPKATCACGFGLHFPWRLVVVGRPGNGGKLTFHGAPHPRWEDPQIVLNRCVACHQVSFVDAASGLRICRRCHTLDEAGFVTDGSWAEGIHPSGSLNFTRVEPPRGGGGRRRKR